MKRLATARIAIVLLCVSAFSHMSLAQMDTLVIELSNGAISHYSLRDVGHILFASTPTSTREFELANTLVRMFALHDNYPNPFNPTTTIEYEVGHTGDVIVEIYNMLGKRVRSLLRTTSKPGLHQIQWDARDDTGNQAPSGAYLCKVQFNSEIIVKKLLLLK
jgi:hypothetical protein